MTAPTRTPPLMPRDSLDAAQLLADVESDWSSFASYITRLQCSDETREAWWPNQTEDGRKHDTTEMEATPYDGASDQRVRAAEEIVNERVLIQKAAMIGGRSVFEPQEASDNVNAALFGSLMKHFMQKMKREIRDETEFLLEWKEGGALSVLFVGWLEERALEPREITAEDLVQFAIDSGLSAAGLPSGEALQQAAEEGAPEAEMAGAVAAVTEDGLRDLMLSRSLTKELVARIMEFDPEVTKPEALRVARALQAGESGEYYAPYVKESRPQWEALQPGVDVFFSGAVRKLAKAPRITRVHYIQHADLLDVARREEWDKDTLNLVLANPGRAMSFGLNSGAWVMSSSGTRYEFMSDDELVNAGYYQILEVWHRRSSLAGAPCIYRTVLHGSVNKAVLKHEVSRYKHGNYPFLEFRRERKKRPLTSVRSIPEMTATNQDAIKTIHDGRRNRVDLAVSPAIITSGRRSGGRIRIGPDMEIPEARAGTLRWFDPPRMDMDTVALAKDERSMLNSFWGRWSPDVPQPLVQLHQQVLVDDWLTDISEALVMTSQLVQQFVTPEEASRIVGTRFTLDATRVAIQAQWDLRISFDVRNLDLKWLRDKMELVNNFVLAADTMAVVNKARAAEYLFASVDPVMAEHLITPREDAEQNELEDEERALTTIFTGGEPALRQGQDHAARASYMQQMTAASATRTAALQQNPQLAQVWQNRLKWHQTQVAQQRNKQIGRLGGEPVLAKAMSEAGAF